MPSPVTEGERTRIIEAIRGGMTRNDAARNFERSPATISRIAKAAGLSFDRTKTAAATKAKQADNRERRAGQVVEFLTEIDSLISDIRKTRQRMWGPYTAVDLDARSGRSLKMELDQPDAAAFKAFASSLKDLVVAFGSANSTILRIEAVDKPDAGYGLLEQIADAIEASDT